MKKSLLNKAKLARQNYGIAMSQVTFGGPMPGIWLECSGCNESQRIVGSRWSDDPYRDITDAEAAGIFRRHGWTGESDRMLKAKCPKCSAVANAA